MKEQEVAFKTRLLELVEIFVSRQSSNLSLSFIPVLLMLMQRSQKFPEETSLSEKAGILLKYVTIVNWFKAVTKKKVYKHYKFHT